MQTMRGRLATERLRSTARVIQADTTSTLPASVNVKMAELLRWEAQSIGSDDPPDDFPKYPVWPMGPRRAASLGLPVS